MVTASDGDEAIRLYSQAKTDDEAFDVVILDLTIPGVKGDLKAILGFNAMIQKPYNMTELTAQIHRLVVSR